MKSFSCTKTCIKVWTLQTGSLNVTNASKVCYFWVESILLLNQKHAVFSEALLIQKIFKNIAIKRVHTKLV